MTTSPPTKEVLIPVGFDIGSLNARIALSSLISDSPESTTASTASSGSSTTQQQQQQLLPHCYRCPTPGSIVPNESGERYTLALSTIEPKAVADPSNDQYWDAPSPTNSRNKKKKVEEEAVEYIFGEAARRSLQQEKKSLIPQSVRSLLVDDGNDEDGGEENGEGEQRREEKHATAQAFLSHLITQATNAAHSHPSSLRLVLATPDIEYDNNNNTRTTEGLVKVAQQALIHSIRKTGWESSPNFQSGLTMNKREKKNKIEQLEAIPRIVAVITESMAVCHAHDLFQFTEYGPAWSKPNNNNSPPPTDFTNILVLDWGHASLKLTHLQRLSPTTQMLTSAHTQSHPKFSGSKLLSILVTHVSELFARQPSCRGCGFKSADVLSNRKARAKLDSICEGALRTLSAPATSKVQVAVDGLYEGMDCNVEVRKARFDMEMGGFLRGAEEVVKAFVGNVGGVEVDVVLTAGNAVCMPAASAIVDRVCAGVGGGVWRGRGVAEVPPEETVAMGCAMYAATMTSAFCKEGLMMLGDENGVSDTDNDGGDDELEVCGTNAVEEHVPLCPVGVGLVLQEGDSASIVLIESGTPLPASVAKTVDVTGCSTGSLEIVQIGCLIDGAGDATTAVDNGTKGTNTATKDKVVGLINGIPKGVDGIEVCMELSVEGKISICVNNGPIITF